MSIEKHLKWIVIMIFLVGGLYFVTASTNTVLPPTGFVINTADTEDLFRPQTNVTSVNNNYITIVNNITNNITTYQTNNVTTTVMFNITNNITNNISNNFYAGWITVENYLTINNTININATTEVTNNISNEIFNTIYNNISNELFNNISTIIVNNVSNEVINNIYNNDTIQNTIINNVTTLLYNNIMYNITNDIINNYTITTTILDNITMNLFNTIYNNYSIYESILVNVSNNIYNNLVNNITNFVVSNDTIINSITANITANLTASFYNNETINIVNNIYNITYIYNLSSISNYLVTTPTTIDFNESLLNATINSLIIDNNITSSYAQYSSNSTQNIASTSTPQLAIFEHTDIQYNINKNGLSNFSVNISGHYIIHVSAVVYTGVNDRHIELWFRKNSVDIPASNTIVNIPNTNAEIVVALPFIVYLNTTDKLQLLTASSDSTLVGWLSRSNTSYSPAQPSIIMAMSRVGN